MRRIVLLLPLTLVLAGCPVFPTPTPVSATHLTEPATKTKYWIYVPSYYTGERDWPLVVTLHGTHGWDSSRTQILEWKGLAERRGLIVAAPRLRSVQGILPVVKRIWFDDLAKDERSVLGVIEDVSARYRIDPEAVLLTGFSAGGYPLYYVALRNPEKFSMAIARSCNSSIEVFESIEPTKAARDLPIRVFWGKSDLGALRDQSWQAFRWLRQHRFFETRMKEIKGGHLRQAERAYQFWLEYIPSRHKK